MSKRRNRKRTRTRRTKTKKRTGRKTLPATFNGKSRSQFSITRTGPTSIRVTGYDLIYDPEEKIVEGPFCCIPSNPAYWKGTRIAQIATSYAQFRPLSFKAQYKPQVSTMTSGNIITGTVWNNEASSNSTKQSLATSNGGRVFPVYSTQTIPISLKTNLQQNLFNFQGYLGSESNPFTFLALAQHTNNIVPGYFMVHYVYEFKNPLGNGSEYETQVCTAGEIKTSDVWETTTAMLLTDTWLAAIGTRLIIKVVESQIEFWLSGSRIGMLADCVLKLFKNRNQASNQYQEDIDDLSESNRIGHCMFTFMPLENGTGVNYQFIQQGFLSIDDFVPLAEVMPEPSRYMTGIIFKLTQIGTGRYDISALAIENAETSRIDLAKYFVIELIQPNGLKEYSFRTMNLQYNPGVNEIMIDEPQFQLLNQDSAPITVNLYVETSDTRNWVTLRDIALETVESAFNIDHSKIVGTGDRLLLPLHSKPRTFN